MLGTYALSAGYYDAFYLKAQKVRTLIKRDFDEVFGSGIDALVAPTSPSVAFKFGARTADPVAMYLSDACTLPANMAGIAGVSRPVRPLRGPARRAAVHRPAVVRARAAALRPRLRGDHRRRRLARASSRPSSRSPTTPPAPTPAERAARARGLTGGGDAPRSRLARARSTPRSPRSSRPRPSGAPRPIDLIASESEPSRRSSRRSGRFRGEDRRGLSGPALPPRDPLRRRRRAAAIDRAKALFGAEHANVQPSSGVNANLAVYRAVLKPGDAVLALRLAHGGHLSHGDPASITGAVYRFEHYGVRQDTETIDLDEVRDLARAPPAAADRDRRELVPARDRLRRRSREIAREVDALLHVDMAHVAGLVAGGVLAEPRAARRRVTFTTYKTMLGPHGGVILARAGPRPSDRPGDLPGHPGRARLRADRGEGRLLRDRGDGGVPRRPSGRSSTTPRALAAALGRAWRPDRERRHGHPHGRSSTCAAAGSPATSPRSPSRTPGS